MSATNETRNDTVVFLSEKLIDGLSSRGHFYTMQFALLCLT
jgi:hypothetical protein